MRILLQLILYCALFFLLVKLGVRNDGRNCLYFYPKEYQKRAVELGLADAKTLRHRRKAFMTPFLLILAVALVLIIAGWNHVTDFRTAYGQAALFLVVMNWFDAIVLDRIWVGHSKIWVIPEMNGYPYLKPWKEIIPMRAIATVVYLVLAVPAAGLIVSLAKG